MKQILIIFLVLISIDLRAQWNRIDTSHIRDSIIEGVYIPKNIDECIEALSKSKYDYLTPVLLIIPEDSIDNHYESGVYFYYRWCLDEQSRLTKSRLTKYFNDLGIKNTKNMQNIILHTYYRKIHNIPIRFNDVIAKYKDIELREELKYKKRLQLDTIDGVYIPKDIKECFLELNKILPKEEFEKFKGLKDISGTIDYHEFLGTWIRNNWGLWAGSRLQVYMLDRLIDHPDDMSSIILESYWEWLHGINENWEKFDKKNQ